MTRAWLLPLLALLPFAAAALLAFVDNRHKRSAAWVAGATALAGCALVAAMAPAVFGGEVLRWSVEWVPALGLRFGFRIDGLAWMFALLIVGIGALVVLYGAYYLGDDDPPARFFLFLMLFMGAMLGVVTADNLILLVVFWELTSLSSFLLIGYWHARGVNHEGVDIGRDARQGARMALTITGAGGLCLLAGALLIGHIVGSTQLDVVLASGDQIRAHPMYLPALVLVLLGCFTKSAQFPFHFWLPHAMAAPTPVSAYLHSATMVKAGVFLLARLYPALGQSEPWFWIVSLTGLVTLVFAAWVALFKHDLKGLLAYSTVSHLGLITLLFGLDTPLAVVAGVFHILNHATFKASLFMAAGIIDHETGTRDMRKLNGLWAYMPVTGALAMVASAAMAGVPLLNGFLSKEMFFVEAVNKQTNVAMEWLLPLGATLAAVFSVAYSLRFIHDVFFNGRPVGLTQTPHEPPRFMRIPVELLVVICLAVGLLPALTVGPVLAVGAQAALFGAPGQPLPEYKLAIWHGFNVPLAMSLVALAGGVVLYFALQRRVNLHRLERPPVVTRVGGRDVFQSLLAQGVELTMRVTGGLQSGSLQRYLLLLFIVILAAGALPWLIAPGPVPWPTQPLTGSQMPGLAVWAVFALTMAATVATVICHERRLLALLLLGAVGLGVSLTFVYFSAPDLALTQLLVEVATIILMMLALRWLPAESPPATRGSTLRRSRDAVIAVACGLGVAALAWWVFTLPFDSISPYFLQTTVPEGGGSNAVNVIIVDYRGFDTLGEITVLGIAGLLIHALLAGWRVPPGLQGTEALPPRAADSHPLMLALVTRLLLPLAVLVSIYLFLRGHNLPGGGFIAGLVLAIALVMQWVANGGTYAAARVRTDFSAWVAWGLLIASGAGVGSWFFGSPFLTSTYDYPLWPLVGHVPLASASVFDLGVFLTVVGGTMLALVAMGRLTGDTATGVAPDRAGGSR
jgi:multicomponent K+:H+ antiporter subunit A